MKNKLISILETFGFPVFLQGSLNDDEEYPPSFFTFWNFETPERAHYDNRPHRAEWGFWIYFYSNDPSAVDTTLAEAIKLLQEQGFVTDGKGEDVASDEITHTGRMVTCIITENY